MKAHELKDLLKSIVRGAYDLQKLRIQMGNRVSSSYRAQHQLPSKGRDDNGGDIIQFPDLNKKISDMDEHDRVTDTLAVHHEESEEKEDGNLLMKIETEYKDLMKNRQLLPTPKHFTPDETSLISTYPFLIMVKGYIGILGEEQELFKNLAKVLTEFPIYNSWLKDVRGVGPIMSGVILSEFDIHKAKYASSLHQYAGLGVKNGKGTSRQKEHLVETTYTDSEGKEQTKMGISFNPFLKTKLIGVLGSSFLKQPADKCKYREVYDNYKNRLENMPAHNDKTKGHRHNMAIRYAVKIFLIDLYAEWRAIEGLEVHPPYHEAKLGLYHGQDVQNG